MFDANREHKETLARMEQKFFEEKVWLCCISSKLNVLMKL